MQPIETNDGNNNPFCVSSCVFERERVKERERKRERERERGREGEREVQK